MADDRPDARQLSPSTVAVTAGRPPHEADQPLSHPITMASTFVGGGEREYGRSGNPTWEAFEDVLGRLEGGRALAFSSGLAAVSTVLDLVGQGALVVAPDAAYQGSLAQIADLELRGRLVSRLVDIADTDAVLAALDEDVALVWVESPTNPNLDVADLERICTRAHEVDAYVVVDNTFATPLLQQPIAAGADIVVHSATKYLSGHSDVLLGALVTNDEQLYPVLRQRRELQGSNPGTLEAWLATRGMRTLHLRVERAQANAMELARRLGEHPAVARVRYPGFGCIVSIELAAGPLAADLLTRKTRLWVFATSLGGVESTLERRRRWKGESQHVSEALVRLSVGVEDVEDLWADLGAALDGLVEAATDHR